MQELQQHLRIVKCVYQPQFRGHFTNVMVQHDEIICLQGM